VAHGKDMVVGLTKSIARADRGCRVVIESNHWMIYRESGK
jgi:hypothetical protein